MAKAKEIKNIGTASIFEKTMAACLESKRAPAGKRVVESAKKPAKKLKKESVISGKLFEDEMDELEDNEVMDDIVDDVVVVVDPEISADEIDELGAEAQEIIDSTPEDEIPMTDEYIGDLTYTCPICGNTFFSEVEMNDGDECPVCGDFPNGYVLVGEVSSVEDEEEEEEEVIDDEVIDDEIIDDVTEEPVEDEEVLEPDVPAESFKRMKAERKTRVSKYSIDESTFNPFMTKFIRENYRNAKSFAIKGAKLNGSKLSLECALTFKSGKSKSVVLTVENFKPAKRMVLAAREDGTFKVESTGSKVAPFVFEATMDKNIISCKGLKYNLVTKAVKEGTRVQISGKLIRESKKK